MQGNEHIGARIAAERKLRGLTQYQLADRACVSVSLLRKVEQGSKPASAALLSSVARALRIEQATLTGQPYFSGNRKLDAVHDLIPELRRELSQHGVAYTRLGVALPGLLRDLRVASFATSGAAKAKVMLLMYETYDNAKRLVYDLGYADLGRARAH